MVECLWLEKKSIRGVIRAHAQVQGGLWLGVSGFSGSSMPGHSALTHLLSFCPSQCPSKTFGTFSSTKDFPDDVIQFARNHPLMYNSVLPHDQRPIFLQTNVDYTFTHIVVDRVAAADGHYDVLFIGTGVSAHLPQNWGSSPVYHNALFSLLMDHPHCGHLVGPQCVKHYRCLLQGAISSCLWLQCVWGATFSLQLVSETPI